MINTGPPRYITLRLWGERKEGGKEGRKLGDGGVFGRGRTTRLSRGGSGEERPPPVSVKFSRPTLNLPFANASSASQIPSFTSFLFSAATLLNGLKRSTPVGVASNIFLEGKGLERERFPRLTTALSIFFAIPFPFFSFLFFVNPRERVTANRSQFFRRRTRNAPRQMERRNEPRIGAV